MSDLKKNIIIRLQKCLALISQEEIFLKSSFMQLRQHRVTLSVVSDKQINLSSVKYFVICVLNS